MSNRPRKHQNKSSDKLLSVNLLGADILLDVRDANTEEKILSLTHMHDIVRNMWHTVLKQYI